jgi:hypothetical protein
MVARRLNGMAAIAGLRGLRGLRGLGQAESGMDIFGEPIASPSSDASAFLAAAGALPGSTQPGSTQPIDTSTTTGSGGGFWSQFGRAAGSVLGSATGQMSQAAINQGVCAINPNDPRCAPTALKKIGSGGGGMPWGTIALVGGGALVLILLLGRRKAAAA